jgi:hypothetical protein
VLLFFFLKQDSNPHLFDAPQVRVPEAAQRALILLPLPTNRTPIGVRFFFFRVQIRFRMLQNAIFSAIIIKIMVFYARMNRFAVIS